MAEIHLIGRAASPGLAIGPVTMLTAAVPRPVAYAAVFLAVAAVSVSYVRGYFADYRKLLEEIERDGFHVLDQRIALPPLRKAWIAWKTSWSY